MAGRTAVHALADSFGSELLVNLPLMQGLRFRYVPEAKRFDSVEYPGLHVARFQGGNVDGAGGASALVGLKHGLLLIDAQGDQNSRFLCPHAKTTCAASGEVSVAVESPRIPPFFVYEVRPELQDLTA
ncbi:unnamed protein product, partial [Amoebophrya sp. A120]|eukprot:GSA120T00005226001.1